MANWGTSLAPTIAGLNEDGLMTVNGEASHFAAGCGARTFRDGVDTGGIIVNTTASIPPIETVEAEYPILYLFRRQLIDSGGPGRFRGGVGARRGADSLGRGRPARVRLRRHRRRSAQRARSGRRAAGRCREVRPLRGDEHPRAARARRTARRGRRDG